MGFPTGISGADLVWRGEVQAMKFGTRFVIPGAWPTGALGDAVSAVPSTTASASARRRNINRRSVPTAANRAVAEFEGAGVYYAAPRVKRVIARMASRHRRRRQLGGSGSDVPQPLGEACPGHRSRAVLGRIHVELPVEPA